MSAASTVTIAGAFVSPRGREHDQVIGFGPEGWFVAPAAQAAGGTEWLPMAAADLLNLIQKYEGGTMNNVDGQGTPAPFVMPAASTWARGETRPAQICVAALRQVIRHDPNGVCGGIAAMALLAAGEAIGPLT